MEDTLKSWLFDPAVGKLVTASIGLIVIVVLVRFSRRSLGRYIQHTETRYRTRKIVTVLGYFVAYKLRRATQDRIFTRVLEEIDKTHDQVGIAASTLNIEKMPPLSVSVGMPAAP